jgi:hypothetical protein
MSRMWLIASLASLSACIPATSYWKVPGGPQACRDMCAGWGLQFAGMVGVGDQDPYRDRGATACVCQVAGGPPITPQAAATATAVAAAVATHQEEEEERRKKDREEEERKQKQKQQDEKEKDKQKQARARREHHQRG